MPALRRPLNPLPVVSLLAALMLHSATVLVSRAAESSPPQFSGFLSSPASGALFSLQWQSSDGARFQAWLRLGQRAGGFKLLEFDPRTEILSVEDASGQRHALRLPDGKVQPETESLTDAEFSAFLQFEMQGADTSNAPVLSRAKARAYYLEKVRRMFGNVENVELVFDLTGATLPPVLQATWAEDQRQARAAGFIRRAVIIDGQTKLHEFPLRPFPLPEQMTRNLTESDWDELGLLVATSSLKSRLQRRASTPK